MGPRFVKAAHTLCRASRRAPLRAQDAWHLCQAIHPAASARVRQAPDGQEDTVGFARQPDVISPRSSHCQVYRTNRASDACEPARWSSGSLSRFHSMKPGKKPTHVTCECPQRPPRRVSQSVESGTHVMKTSERSCSEGMNRRCRARCYHCKNHVEIRKRITSPRVRPLSSTALSRKVDLSVALPFSRKT
jgi:hypothetical protein